MNVTLYDHRGQLIEEVVQHEDWRDAAMDLYQEQIAQLQERFSDLSIELENLGWERMSGETSGFDFSRRARLHLCQLARTMAVKNPLIKRAVQVQRSYVWGQGVSIKASDERVNEVVQEFLDDKKNQAELTSQQAYEGKEETLQTSGNIFFVFFPNPSTGLVRIRTIPPDEIEDIICDPNDARSPWLYKRVWLQQELDARSGAVKPVQKVAFYADWRFTPGSDDNVSDAERFLSQKPKQIGGSDLLWETPVYHVKVGGLDGMKFGLPDVYAALDWARAAKEHLEDWAAVYRALAQFAWRLKTQHGARGVAAAKAKLGTTAATGTDMIEHNPAPLAASTFIESANVSMEPMRTAGARPSPEEAHYLWLMVASGTGLPEIFFGNADVGNHATAKTLDRPTELLFTGRQRLWTDILAAIMEYVVMWAVRAPSGLLAPYAQITPTRSGDDEIIDWKEAPDPEDETKTAIDPHIEIRFPDLLEHDMAERIGSIVSAATLNGHPNIVLPQRRLVELLLGALGIDDVDEEILAMFPDENGAAPGEDDAPDSGIDPQTREAARELRDQLTHLLDTIPAAEADGADDSTDDEPEHKRRREAALLPIAAALIKGITPAETTTDQARELFTTAYMKAYEAGLRQGNPKHVWGSSDQTYVHKTVRSQLRYLRDFTKAAKSGDLSESEIAQRAALYGAPLVGAYNRGLVLGAKENGIDRWVWNTQGDSGCCERCAPRNGVEYLTENLPGFPGEGDFGSDLCLGGPQCRCWLEPAETE